MLRRGRAGLRARFPFSELMPSLVLVAQQLEMECLGCQPGGVCMAPGSRQGLGVMEKFGSSGCGYHRQGAPSREQLGEGSFISAVLGADSCLGEDFHTCRVQRCVAIEPGVSSLLVGDFTPKKGRGGRRIQGGAAGCPAKVQAHAELSPALHGVLLQCGTESGGTRAAQGLSVRGQAALHKCLPAAGGRRRGSSSSI